MILIYLIDILNVNCGRCCTRSGGQTGRQTEKECALRRLSHLGSEADCVTASCKPKQNFIPDAWRDIQRIGNTGMAEGGQPHRMVREAHSVSWSGGEVGDPSPNKSTFWPREGVSPSGTYFHYKLASHSHHYFSGNKSCGVWSSVSRRLMLPIKRRINELNVHRMQPERAGVSGLLSRHKLP